MGLESFKGGVAEKKGVKWSKDKLHKPHLCPECGTNDTEVREYYRVCNNSDCDVITYKQTKYERGS